MTANKKQIKYGGNIAKTVIILDKDGKLLETYMIDAYNIDDAHCGWKFTKEGCYHLDKATTGDEWIKSDPPMPI